MKKIIYLLIIILLTGCSASYDVVLNEDLSVLENVKVIGDDRFILGNNYTVDSMYDTLIDTYSELYNEEEEVYIEKKSLEDRLMIESNKEYDNIKKFAVSNYVKTFYKSGFDVLINDKIVTIKSIDDVSNLWLFMDDMDNDPLLNELHFTLKLPFKVIESNADIENVKENTYIWKYDFNSYNKKFEIVFDTSQFVDEKFNVTSFFKYIGIFLGIAFLGYLLYKKINLKNKSNNKV